MNNLEEIRNKTLNGIMERHYELQKAVLCIQEESEKERKTKNEDRLNEMEQMLKEL